MFKSEKWQTKLKLYFYNQNQKTVFVTDNINLLLDEVKKIPEHETLDYYKTCSGRSYGVSEIEKVCKENNIQFCGTDNDASYNYNLLCTCCGG